MDAPSRFDVLVIGAGHAGCEAALAASRLGCTAGLVTLRADRVAEMSCNPAIGGLAKGTLVREIDALGGAMGQLADATGLQFRMLGRRHGPAVWGPRAQCDKRAYREAMTRLILADPQLTLIEGEAAEILAEGGRVAGACLADGRELRASKVVLTTGTFLRGLMHCGTEKIVGGRVGEPAANRLSDSLRSLGFELGRLKTGTPPRLSRATLDFSKTREQPGDEPPPVFSYSTEPISRPQQPCYLTRTTAATHAVVRANLHRAPLFTGQITGRGPRYCPSLEDKVHRFPQVAGHLVFLEPEEAAGDWIYANGISTSLPAEVQAELVRTIPGLEAARILRFGYAVEYDFVPPHQTQRTLEARRLAGLYFAGQINGTSGYEEAAGQGLVAGANAALALQGREPFVPDRASSYLGLLLDDLATKEIREPYRLFTSRSEFRLALRQDNADRRLTPLAARLGLVVGEAGARVARLAEEVARAVALLGELRRGPKTLAEFLRRPEVRLAELVAATPELAALNLSPRAVEQAELEVKYAPYLERMNEEARLIAEGERVRLPAEFKFRGLPGLSREAQEVLERFRPATLGQAARLAGVRASDLAVLEVHLVRRSARP